jgi:curved DNA-binding protein CbpA
MANPYETLGVAPDASQDDIRKAYRKAAKETHPDLNPGKPEAEKRFKEINAAYDIVGDADKRKRYDAGEIDETGAERQTERHFYREYAEADPNMRYRRRRPGSETGQGSGAHDFDYGHLRRSLPWTWRRRQLPYAAAGCSLYARDRFPRCSERHAQDGSDAGWQDA